MSLGQEVGQVIVPSEPLPSLAFELELHSDVVLSNKENRTWVETGRRNMRRCVVLHNIEAPFPKDDLDDQTASMKRR
jgi:hypothetical protein